MKKVIYVILSLIIFLSVTTSCSNDKPSRKLLAENVLLYFKNKDIDGLKSMFCEKIQSTHDLDEEIQTAFDFLDGEIIDYTIHYGSDGESYDNGILTKKEYGIQVRNIITNKSKEYIISFAYRPVDVNNPDKIGLSKLSIVIYNNKKIDQNSKKYVGENV